MSSAQSGASQGLSLKTLLISAAAAAVAAVVVQQFWETGTLIAAAMTPVIIAVVSEALHKPVAKISEVSTWRRTPDGTAIREPVSARRGPQPFDPLPPEERDVAPRVSSEDPYRLYRPKRRPRHHWRIALATGLLAFFIAAAVVTASELAIFGGSVSESGRRTTFFGGNGTDRSSNKQDEKETPTASPTESPEDEESPTATPTETATPEDETPTPTPTPTPSPSPGAAPEQPTPTTTPPPAATPPPQP